ncbi:MAG: PhoX family phosphatase [Elainellaceae cyanobacterium]
MSLKRRHFLAFMGAVTGAAVLSPLARNGLSNRVAAETGSGIGFKPVKGPMPVSSYGVAPGQQPAAFGQFSLLDDLVLPEGYTYDVVATWGDPVGDSRFGYNNDYLALVETAPGEGYLTVNFEYISGKTWMETFSAVVDKTLPLEAVRAAAVLQDGEIDVLALSDEALKGQIIEIAKESMIDQGIGVIAVRREENGQWMRTFSEADRRITGISGLEDDRYLAVTGPAAAVFNKPSKLGYDDGLGDRIIGTFQNCGGGVTPWGTVLSAEENFQAQVPEAVMPDGSAMSPDETPFVITDKNLDGRGNVFGLPGNKYGWMVEVDPANPDDYGTKHSWLGRFRHEAVAVRAVAARPLAVYSGCDRRGGHLYKFVSADVVSAPTDKANSRLMADGMLYAAKFSPDGTGRWIPIAPSTPVAPNLPSSVAGGLITLPQRPEGGWVKVEDDPTVAEFQQRYATLGDLYEGNDEEKQGAILIDAHYAANAAGATHTARPEDTDVTADGTLFIAFTSGGPGGDGGPDASVFVGPNGETPYEYGWIMKLREDDGDPAATGFTWEMMALGGEPAEGGAGFANPDNIEIDAKGNVWMVTDMSTGKHNAAVPNRISDETGEPVSQSNLRGLFGNNSVWVLPTAGDRAGEAFMFAYGPMECEMTGPFLSSDETTLFLAAQHPGETHGTRKDGAAEARQFAMKTTEGDGFTQLREVPLGSNWPDKTPNAVPKPAVVAVRRVDGKALL